jgi:triphosphatase
VSSRETELKFFLEDHGTGAAAVPAMVARAISGGKKTRVETTYYDTPDRQLGAQGLSVRLRKMSGKRVLSVKASRGRGIARFERELEIRDDRPSAEEWQAVAQGSLLAHSKLRRRMKAFCTTTVDRRSVAVERNGATIEASLDKGSVRTDSGAEIPIHELELEIKSGRVADLFSYATELVKRDPMRISLLSKGARGFLLASNAWARPQPATLPELDPGSDGPAAFQDICMTCLRDFMINEFAIGGPEPVEGIHKTRIAVRRLRSAMTLFRSLLKDTKAKTLSRELNWLSDKLGNARDLDVAVQRSASWTRGNGAALRKMMRRMEAARDEAHHDLASALSSPRCRALLFDFVRWLEIGPWRKQWLQREPALAPALARRLLDKRLQNLLRDARNLAHLDAEECHDIRKDAKKLRYMGEFFLSLAGPERERKSYMKLLAALESLQNALGKVQDRVTLEKLFRAQIAAGDAAETRQAVNDALEDAVSASSRRDQAQRRKAARAIKEIRANQRSTRALVELAQ